MTLNESGPSMRTAILKATLFWRSQELWTSIIQVIMRIDPVHVMSSSCQDAAVFRSES